MIEIKTRAKNSNGPLDSITPSPSHYLQCQLQITCTDAHSCILLSYHPESKAGKFFLIRRDDLIMTIIANLCENISFQNGILSSWNHKETNELKLMGEKIANKQLSFETLKVFHKYIKNTVKRVVCVQFLDYHRFSVQ